MTTPAERTSDRIKVVLQQKFEDNIDLTDLKEQQRASALVTRALSAAYISDKFGLPPQISGSRVTDGQDDMGIDSITVHHLSKRIVLTQGKFFSNPDKGVDLAEFLKFREGVRRVLEVKLSGANSRILAMKPEIASALSEIDYSIEMVLVTNSTTEISTHIADAAGEFLAQQNQYQPDFMRFTYIGLAELSRIATRLARPQSVNFKATVRNFGRMVEPIEVLYGLLSGAEVTALHVEHGESIFFENVRFFLGSSDVNEGIIETVQSNVGLFPYFNNGITAICNAIRKTGAGGALTDAGHFEFEGFSIVNGAQTVGSVSKAVSTDPKKDPLIFVKVISLEKAPEHFARQVTRFTNTQNDLQPMDFVSLDPTQERLRNEFSKFGVHYSYRRGQTSGGSKSSDSCDLREVTIALACWNGEIRYAVYAKRNLSQLWEDIQSPPYSALFNDETTAPVTWNIVLALRFVADVLLKVGSSQEGRDALIAVHGNRFLFHAVCAKFKSEVALFGSLPAETIKKIEDYAIEVFDKACSYSDKHFPEAYAGNIFKNADRQRAILDSFGT